MSAQAMNQLTASRLVKTRRNRFERWFMGMPGRMLLDAECESLRGVFPHLYGQCLLQIGHLGERDLSISSSIQRRYIYDIDPTSHVINSVDSCGRADALPFATESVDVVLLPHILEFEDDPHQVLRETERLLQPEGYLVVLGFNPWSLWGVWRLIMWRRQVPPWSGRFIGLARLKDWLSLLGFDLTEAHCTFFRPPIRRQRLMRQLGFLETAGRRFWPFMGAVYVLVAKKRVATLTPIRLRWRQTSGPLLPAGVAEPTTRSLHYDRHR